MTGVIAPDVSEHNPPVDDSFNRDWLTLRACFGANYTDLHVKHNLAWAKAAKAGGKIKGYAVYVVYLPGENTGILHQLDTLGVPNDVPVMIDAERWGGLSYEIHGDCSTEINQLAVALRQRQGGNPQLVWAYGNRGPDLTVWPNKADWLGWVVASYGGSQPVVPNLAGWQYTDGQSAWDQDGLPSATPPFGRCDHNLLYQLPEDDLPTPQDVWTFDIKAGDGETHAARTWVVQAARNAAEANAKADKLQAELDDLKAQVAALKPSTSGTLHVSGDLNVTQ